MKANLALAASVLRSNLGRLPFPYKLTFCVTYWCNYACKTCNIWQRRPENELTLDEIQHFFRTSNGFNWIDFTGGEVWLRPDFTAIVQAALRHCPNLALLHFPTNGYLTERIVDGVKSILAMKPPRFMITVSIDGDDALNDAIRGKAGGWRRQIETYRQLHHLKGVHAVVGMTLSSHNLDAIDRTFAAVKKECPWLGPRDFHINIAHASPHYYGNGSTAPLPDSRQDVISAVRDYRRKRPFSFHPVDVLERSYLAHASSYLSTGKSPMPCHALRSSCFIDSWGDVYPCGMYDARIASLRDHDYNLAAIWNLDMSKELQKEIWKGGCPHCWTPCEANQTLLGQLGKLRP